MRPQSLSLSPGKNDFNKETRILNQGFRQFCKVADIFLKEPDVAAPRERRKCRLLRGGLRACPPGNILNRTLRNAVFSVSETQESVSQARLEFTQKVSKINCNNNNTKIKQTPQILATNYRTWNGKPPEETCGLQSQTKTLLKEARSSLNASK